ncbi:MAG: hypothetical protein WC047_05460 [Kiritimatiellales bacterium]
MKTTAVILFAATVLLMAGCKTTEPVPVSWQKQSAYMSKVRDPRIYGLSIYQTPSGVEYRGGGRLHPNQREALAMEAENLLRPVVMLRGNFGMKSPVLFDFTSSASWLEFDLAQMLGALPVGERSAQLIKLPGEEITCCLSMVPSMRFKQLYVEWPLVYVRMATGPLGPLARGIEKPELKGVIGWDLLGKFAQIQLNYVRKQVVLSTAQTAYAPDPARVVASIPLIKHAGACAVRGIVDGRESLILIDPAGDFEFATDGAATVSTIQLDADLIFSGFTVTNSPGGLRIGARLLQNYQVTVCPQAGAAYFEKPDTDRDK